MLFLFVAVFISLSSQASQIEVGLGHYVTGTYEVSSLSSEYENQGNFLSLSYLTRNFAAPIGSLFYWGAMFKYKSLGSELEDGSTATAFYPQEYDRTGYNLGAIGGLYFSDFDFHVVAIYSIDEPQTGAKTGDQNYGLGFKASLGYRFYSNFLAAISYEQINYTHGKNSSTGESGTLQDEISESNIGLALTYSFTMGSGL